MEVWQFILFITACFALNMAPGPNNLLAMNNARCFGFKTSVAAGLGRILAFSVMIALAASGLAAVLYTSEMLFFVIKLCGALYLFYLALNLWRSGASPAAEKVASRGVVSLAKQELALAAGNPKAILIFTAFLPQFVDVSGNVEQQFLVLGGTFLILELVAICIYACFGLYLKHWFSNPKMAKRFNRACAGFLTFSGANLLLSKQ